MSEPDSAGPPASASARRVLLLAMLIPEEPDGMSVKQMQRKLEELGALQRNVRTIQRDVRAISESIETLCGQGLKRTRNRADEEQWSWPKEAGAIRLGAHDQGAALALAMLDTHLGHMLPGSVTQSLQPAIDAGKRLLENSLDPDTRNWQQKIAVLHGGMYRQAPRVDPDVMERINEALFQERRIKMVFSKGASEESGLEEKTRVAPLGLIFDRNIASLLCRLDDSKTSEERVPLHRIRSVKLELGSVSEPLRSSLQELLWRPPEHTGQGKQIQVSLSATQVLAMELGESPLGDDQRVSPIGDDRFVIEATVRNEEALRQWVQANAHRCTVLEPQDLVREIRERLLSALDEGEPDRARAILAEKRTERQLATKRRDWSTAYFWIDPWNQTVPLGKAHLAAVLDNPTEYLGDVSEEDLGRWSKQEILARVVENHWIPIEKRGEEWRAMVKDLDPQIRKLIAFWLEEMRKLGLAAPDSVVRIVDMRSGGRQEILG